MSERRGRVWARNRWIVLALIAGCSSNNTATSPYQYTEQDMEQFAVGTWSGTWDAGKGAVPFTLEVHRPTVPAKMPLCGTRQFNSLHPLCIDASQMRLDGTLNVSDASLANVALVGEMTVPSTQLTGVMLDFKDPSSDLQLFAQWASDHWDLCRAERASGIIASCTLESSPSK